MKKFLLFFVILFSFALITPAQDYEALSYWEKPQNIKVYIPPHKYSVMMKHAFEYWARVTTHRISFVFVDKKDKAQDIVYFTDKLDGDTVGLMQPYHRIYTFPNGTQKIELAYINIYIAENNSRGEPLTKDAVYTIMLHEIGHSLGLDHTQNTDSVMYPMANGYKNMEVMREDLNHLKRIYKW